MVDSRRRWSFSLAQDSREARHALRQHCRAARLDTRRHQDTQHQDGDWVEQSGVLTLSKHTTSSPENIAKKCIYVSFKKCIYVLV